MNVILLAAGLGTRLKPITLTTPKCLVPIQRKPLLDYWLEMLVSSEAIDKIYVNTHYKSEMVTQYINANWSHQAKIELWHEPELLGTAGTLLKNIDVLKNHDLMLVHADNLSSFDLDDFVGTFYRRAKSVDMLMMLFKTDTPQSCGIVEMNSQQRILQMHEKVANPPGDLANAAVYILSQAVLSYIETSKPSDFSQQVIPHFLGRIMGWINQDYHRDIGTLHSYALAQTEFKTRLTNE